MLELFKFANLCIDPSRIPAYLFRAWAGFKNIVWSHDTDLPIYICAKHHIGIHTIEYMAAIADSNGQAVYLDEKLTISDYLSVTRELDEAKFKLDPKFLERIKPHIPENLQNRIASDWASDVRQTKSILPYIRRTLHRITTNRYRTKQTRTLPNSSTYYSSDEIDFFHWYPESGDKLLFIPSIRIDRDDDSVESFIHQHAVSFFAGRHPIILLRQLNYAALRESPSVGTQAEMGEDGMGLVNILFRWRNSLTELPDRITSALESLFPKWQIRFTVTDDGRILLNVHDGNTILHPPSIPDGFYKLLTILTAIELKPKFLLIDEIETSLHAKVIEYLIGELIDCDSNVVITTHSPAVIDAVRLEDLVLLERTDTGTTARKIDNPERLRKKLFDLGVTASEGWLYGKL